MIYKDKIYGDVEITDPLAIELFESPAIQRLREISQLGYYPFYPGDHNRFDHSLGVYCLLKSHGAPLLEQIAGLIHDVSHSAFSHCIDYVLECGSEKEHNHQDNIFKEFVENSEISGILSKYGLSVDDICRDENFPLKEKDLPDLCADRIDYALRDAVFLKELDRGDADYFLDNLAAENGDWIFRDFESAGKFAELFQRLNSKLYSNIKAALMFRAVGDCLKYALSAGYISQEDLYTTDKAILAKVRKNSHRDEKLKLLLDRMDNKVAYRNNPDDYDAKVFCKSRVVDPLCRHRGELRRVSRIDEKWKSIIEMESKPKEYFLKFER